MKKTIILLLAAVMLIACKKEEQPVAATAAVKYPAKTVTLSNQNDSMNYAYGLLSGAQFKYQFFHNELSESTINDFIDALQRGYGMTKVELVGKNIGQMLYQFETVGLWGNSAWAVNQPLFFQGLVNGLYNDPTVMTFEIADNFMRSQSNQIPTDSTTLVAITGPCPEEVMGVELNNFNDSVNYALGYVQANQIAMILPQDSTDIYKQLIKSINTHLVSKTIDPQHVMLAESFALNLKEYPFHALLGEPALTTTTDFSLIKQGVINGLRGNEQQMTFTAANEYRHTVIALIQFGDNKIAGEKFLAENAKREGVTVTASGLQYEVIKMGEGNKPSATDKVKVHYHGTFIDGKVFDSSIERGEPISFGLNNVIKGWTEGVQLMPVGSKFRFYIPQELAYGKWNGPIPPFSTLIFEVELLGIE